MRRSAGAALVLALLLALPVSGQSFYVGGGLSIPTSDYGDYAKNGFLVNAGVMIAELAPAVSLYVDGALGMNNHDTDGDKTTLFSTMGGVEYDFGGEDAESGIYVFGQAGIMWHKYSSDTFPDDEGTESGFGFGGGLGGYFPLGGVNGWVQGLMLSADIEGFTTAVFAIMAGISVGG